MTVNGLSVPQGSENASSTGFTNIWATSRDGLAKHIIDAEWESFCLSRPSALRDSHGRPVNQTLGQFLSFIIRRFDGRPLEGDHGFSASYVQHPAPQIFRFESAVLPKPEGAATKDWLLASEASGDDGAKESGNDATPSPSSDDVVSEATSSEHQESSFDKDVRELQRLEAEMRRATKAVKAQRQILWGHVKNEFSHLKQDLGQCDSWKCVVKATMGRAQGALHMIRKAHQAHHTSQRPIGGGDNNNNNKQRWAWFWKLPWNRDLRNKLGSTLCPPVDGDSTQSGKSGCAVSDDGPSTSDHHSSPASPKFSGFKNEHERRQHFLVIALVGLQLLACALIPFSILIVVLRYCLRPCRADRRWRRESRHRANLVRRAHRHSALWFWIKGLWRDPLIIDYEEKRALVVEQERILECAMQEELRQLRSAAEAVSSLVQSRTDEQAQVLVPWTQPRRTYAPPSGASSRRNSLPDYRSEASYGEPPPTYDDSNLDDPMASVVVDGFQYDSGIGSSYASHSTGWTPGSSVVGTSVHGDISSDEEDR